MTPKVIKAFLKFSLYINDLYFCFKFFFIKGTQEEWRVVFLITAAVFLVCGLPFMFLAKSEEEDWAKDVPEIEPEKNKIEKSTDNIF